MSFRVSLQNVVRPLVEYRGILALGLSVTCGTLLNNLFPMDAGNRLLRLIALERPPIFHGLVWSYGLLLYRFGEMTIPFLIH